MIPHSNSPQSNSQIVPFEYEGHSIRAIRDGDDIWFIARDVVEGVGSVWNGTASIKHIPEQWRGVRTDVTPGGSQQIVVLSEQGIYFYLARSDKPAALQFQMWLAGDVLPSIRKTGQYSITQSQDPILALMEGVKQTRLAQIELEQRVNQIEARQDAVDTELHHFTVIGYFRTRGKAAPDLNTAQTIGKKASALSRQLGYSIGKTTDPRFGAVSTYHESVLQQILGW